MKKTLFISPRLIETNPFDFKRSFLTLLNLINHHDVGLIVPKNIDRDRDWYVRVIQNFEQCCDIIDFESRLKNNVLTTRCTDFILIKRQNELTHYGGYLTLVDYSMNDFESHRLYTLLPRHPVGWKYLSILATMGLYYDSVNIWVDDFICKFPTNNSAFEINERVAGTLLKDDAIDIIFPSITEFLNSLSSLKNSPAK